MDSPDWLDAGTLTTMASIFTAFAVPMLFFRIQRELQMQKEGETNWIPWADRLLMGAALISVLLVILPLIILPLDSAMRTFVPPAACGAAAILVAGYIPAILAHYRLIFRGVRTGLYDNPEPAERWIVLLTLFLAVAVAVWALWLRAESAYRAATVPGVMNMELGTFVASTVTMVITALALFFTVLSFKKQLRLNFFADYTKRYQEIILGFPEAINEPSFQLDKLQKEIRDKTLRYMRAYFDLCSEEYFLWRNGDLGDNVWREWEFGMKFAFSKPAFQQAWKVLRKDTVYQGDFAEFVENALSPDRDS